MASGVPGEIAGYWAAHQIGGKLPWKMLFQPLINLARDGVPVSTVLAFILSTQEKVIRKNTALTKMFINPLTNKTYVENEKIKHPDLANTLEMISIEPSSFYSGKLAEKIVEENNANGLKLDWIFIFRDFNTVNISKGGIFTLDDLKNYKAKLRKPIEVNLKGNLRMFAMPPPSGGVLVSLILNIMSSN